ncbi:hypothetical protein HPB52_004936 [Rhipicephalus sanguineus]|uniref:Uncharacterized protein n=1 Tax=Rhipicephalus sanguineus TaxID=34632 RepID=A0A9D4SPT8_RHISA|nr:hypothetical protein HPB52_004936 [Rhipicephalus sanguineus]
MWTLSSPPAAPRSYHSHDVRRFKGIVREDTTPEPGHDAAACQSQLTVSKAYTERRRAARQTAVAVGDMGRSSGNLGQHSSFPMMAEHGTRQGCEKCLMGAQTPLAFSNIPHGVTHQFVTIPLMLHFYLEHGSKRLPKQVFQQRNRCLVQGAIPLRQRGQPQDSFLQHKRCHALP